MAALYAVLGESKYTLDCLPMGHKGPNKHEIVITFSD